MVLSPPFHNLEISSFVLRTPPKSTISRNKRGKFMSEGIKTRIGAGFLLSAGVWSILYRRALMELYIQYNTHIVKKVPLPQQFIIDFSLSVSNTVRNGNNTTRPTDNGKYESHKYGKKPNYNILSNLFATENLFTYFLLVPVQKNFRFLFSALFLLFIHSFFRGEIEKFCAKAQYTMYTVPCKSVDFYSF
jgi:hypothetical protein